MQCLFFFNKACEKHTMANFNEFGYRKLYINVKKNLSDPHHLHRDKIQGNIYNDVET